MTVHRFSESDPRPFEGALEINEELKRAKLLFPGELVQPEAFVTDQEGKEGGGHMQEEEREMGREGGKKKEKGDTTCRAAVGDYHIKCRC